ncbi:glutamate 5-kinase [Corynebacterium sp. sy039]|uniref:glutamate 5-kinase n=1 Tax=Corynebacterium sp. sy039 TaxID=2599641 RepID=UPI0011B84D0A|nr:glutamate 5-kinase [Corynebacterium sp. sy039]QDZ43067.1 glutamate 5-kinase [Corynebacterium sp. sy039]
MVSASRQKLVAARRVVVKIGSSSLTGEDYRVNPARIDAVVDAVEARMGRGSDVIIVSSGAVASGMGALGLAERPRDLATKQAAAAVGGVQLAHTWGTSFARYSRHVAQILLTSADSGIRERARNAQRTIDRLFSLGCVPIVNENDTVATEGLRFGDNDRLAALVAHLTYADALILLSDVDGLYDKNPAQPDAHFITDVRGARDLHDVNAGGGGAVGTGGMAAKVQAALLAARGGIPVLMTSADNIDLALSDASVGTMFHPHTQRLPAWKFWVLYAADTSGTISIDAGASAALRAGGTSLLAVGIEQVQGDFAASDIVDIADNTGKVIGRGEVSYDSEIVRTLIGKKTEEVPAGMNRAVIHADYLALY